MPIVSPFPALLLCVVEELFSHVCHSFPLPGLIPAAHQPPVSPLFWACVFIYVNAGVCACTCVETRAWHWVSCFIAVHSLGQGLTEPACKHGERSLSPSPHWDCRCGQPLLAFYVGAGDPNSGTLHWAVSPAQTLSSGPLRQSTFRAITSGGPLLCGAHHSVVSRVRWSGHRHNLLFVIIWIRV